MKYTSPVSASPIVLAVGALVPFPSVSTLIKDEFLDALPTLAILNDLLFMLKIFKA